MASSIESTPDECLDGEPPPVSSSHVIASGDQLSRDMQRQESPTLMVSPAASRCRALVGPRPSASIDLIGEVALVAQSPEHLGTAQARQPDRCGEAPADTGSPPPDGRPAPRHERPPPGRTRAPPPNRQPPSAWCASRAWSTAARVDRAVAQRGQDLPVDARSGERPAPGRRRPAGQLVPEVHLVPAHQQQPTLPAAHRSPPARRRERLRATEPPPARRRAPRPSMHLLRGRRQPGRPGEHGIANSLGNFCGAGRERLGDEERIAPGHPDRDARYHVGGPASGWGRAWSSEQ